MKKFTFILACAIALGSCTNDDGNPGKTATDTASMPPKEEAKEIPKMEAPAEDASIEVRPFQTDGGWGYDIYMDGQLYIHQPHIPAVSGNRAFKDEADARKAGELVAHKIKKNIMPPMITIEELDSIGVLK